MARARACLHGRVAPDAGETLIEVVIAVVVIGIAVGALVSALATSANVGIAQRDGAIADATLRNLAETAKSVVGQCTTGQPLDLAIDVPHGWAGATEPPTLTCPASTETLALRLTVSDPSGHSSTLDVVLRAP